MKSNANVYDAWFNMLNSMTDSWKSMSEKFNGNGQEETRNISEITKSWFENYQETTAKMWEPILKHAQQNSLSYFYMSFLNPVVFRTYMDQSTAAHKTMDQFSSTRYTMTDELISTGKSFVSVFEKLVPSFDNLTKIYPHTMSGWYTDILKATQRNFFPFINQIPDVKTIDWQYNVKTYEYLIRYYNSSLRMQYLISGTAVSAWEKLMREVHGAARNEKPVGDFNQFYNLWSELNSKEFENLLHTKEFVMLQEEVVSIKSELIKRFEKQAELIMQPYPIVSKSQMEEVYHANHDLKKRITKLEKEMAN